jgi:hypothetical protein
MNPGMIPDFFFNISGMFADKYFTRYGRYQSLISEIPDRDLNLFIMIPCFREPDIIRTLESLRKCTLPERIAEVFTIINEPEDCSEEITRFNLKTFGEVSEWNLKNSCSRLRFHTSEPVKLPRKWAGVGMARKRGMDEGLWRFNQTDHKHGIIISLDADTLVETNYLTSIENHFRKNPSHVGATIAFSHQLENIEEKLKDGILLYEKYMNYYKHALDYAGYPNALYTIGSAFAVTAEAYMKRGGMTRRKAGEDFYFLQTLPQVGKVGEITDTAVHPSARVSDRVPFGTGPAMQNWMTDAADLRYSYNIQAFKDLKTLFSRHRSLYQISETDYQHFVDSLQEAVASFLGKEDFFSEISALSDNCAGEEIFSQRFFQLFNAFRILKFINFSHAQFYRRQLLDEAFGELEKLRG